MTKLRDLKIVLYCHTGLFASRQYPRNWYIYSTEGDGHVFHSKTQFDFGNVHRCRYRNGHETGVQKSKKKHLGVFKNIK